MNAYDENEIDYELQSAPGEPWGEAQEMDCLRDRLRALEDLVDDLHTAICEEIESPGTVDLAAASDRYSLRRASL